MHGVIFPVESNVVSPSKMLKRIAFVSAAELFQGEKLSGSELMFIRRMFEFSCFLEQEKKIVEKESLTIVKQPVEKTEAKSINFAG